MSTGPSLRFINSSRELARPLLLPFALGLLVLAAVDCGGKRPPPPPPIATAPSTAPDRDRPPVDVSAPHPLLEIQVAPETVGPGEPALLTWDSQHATRVTIEPAIGQVETSGRIKFFPDDTVTYTVTAEGPGGVVSQSVTLRVTGPAAAIAAGIGEEDVEGLGVEERFEAFVKPVFFAFDSAQLSDDSKVTLDGNARWLLQPENRSIRIVLEGHTDERGSEEYNLALGDQRAAVVMEYLVRNGIEPNRLTPVSLGEERPFDPRSTEEAYSLNRRTHFVILGDASGVR